MHISNTPLGISNGRTLRVGEVLRRGDWRFDGYEWAPIAEPRIGHTFQPNNGKIYVRPNEDCFPR